MSRSRRWLWRRSRLRRSCGGSRPCSRSPPSLGRHSAASASRRPRRRRAGPLPPWPGRSLDEITSHLDRECEWLVTNGVLPADLVTRNRRIAEAALRPWTPVFSHGDLQVPHVFVDGDGITGVVDWSE